MDGLYLLSMQDPGHHQPPGNNVGPGYGTTEVLHIRLTRVLYGNATGPAYESNMGPAYGNTTDPAYPNASGPAYGNTTTPTNANASGPAYGNVGPTYSNGMGAPYGYQ
ncbi:hypothetical protein GH714_008652 [Hevea brasiliensis]|uniref:Uncharacterized protein n=1 Tax=Hevea brasiliensis TaxID=3981 RepID=A0A6A6KAP7_HEVBR|nr:hypothetical protein GH714_008652 [Hevea brasiliensis]